MERLEIDARVGLGNVNAPDEAGVPEHEVSILPNDDGALPRPESEQASGIRRGQPNETGLGDPAGDDAGRENRATKCLEPGHAYRQHVGSFSPARFCSRVHAAWSLPTTSTSPPITACHSRSTSPAERNGGYPEYVSQPSGRRIVRRRTRGGSAEPRCAPCACAARGDNALDRSTGGDVDNIGRTSRRRGERVARAVPASSLSAGRGRAMRTTGNGPPPPHASRIARLDVAVFAVEHRQPAAPHIEAKAATASSSAKPMQKQLERRKALTRQGSGSRPAWPPGVRKHDMKPVVDSQRLAHSPSPLRPHEGCGPGAEPHSPGSWWTHRTLPRRSHREVGRAPRPVHLGCVARCVCGSTPPGITKVRLRRFLRVPADRADLQDAPVAIPTSTGTAASAVTVVPPRIATSSTRAA